MNIRKPIKNPIISYLEQALYDQQLNISSDIKEKERELKIARAKHTELLRPGDELFNKVKELTFLASNASKPSGRFRTETETISYEDCGCYGGYKCRGNCTGAGYSQTRDVLVAIEKPDLEARKLYKQQLDRAKLAVINYDIGPAKREELISTYQKCCALEKEIEQLNENILVKNNYKYYSFVHAHLKHLGNQSFSNSISFDNKTFQALGVLYSEIEAAQPAILELLINNNRSGNSLYYFADEISKRYPEKKNTLVYHLYALDETNINNDPVYIKKNILHLLNTSLYKNCDEFNLIKKQCMQSIILSKIDSQIKQVKESDQPTYFWMDSNLTQLKINAFITLKKLIANGISGYNTYKEVVNYWLNLNVSLNDGTSHMISILNLMQTTRNKFTMFSVEPIKPGLFIEDLMREHGNDSVVSFSNEVGSITHSGLKK